MARFLVRLREAVWHALDDDVVNTSKAVAYSGMLMLFPAMMVMATLLAQGPEGTTLVGEFRGVLEQFLPADSMDLLQYSLETHRTLSAQLVLSGSGLSAFAALGMMLSLMEGFRRAYRLPRLEWGFWARRIRAVLLIFIALIPLALAALLIIFGRQIEQWMVINSRHELRLVVLVFWRVVRWAIALLTSVSVLGALYHYGTRRTEDWAKVAPGAIASALGWFAATLVFGFYVTRIANYTMFYGSFGAGIATLVWIYISAFCALMGAELNAILFRERRHEASAQHDSYDPSL